MGLALPLTLQPRMAAKKQNPPSTPAGKLPVPAELIDRRIYIVRGRKVMLDADLAELYQVEPRVLNQAVRRNPDRFPEDFMFQLTAQEGLGSKITNCDLRKGPRPLLQICAAGFYRAGCGHAVLGAQ